MASNHTKTNERSQHYGRHYSSRPTSGTTVKKQTGRTGESTFDVALQDVEKLSAAGGEGAVSMMVGSAGTSTGEAERFEKRGDTDGTTQKKNDEGELIKHSEQQQQPSYFSSSLQQHPQLRRHPHPPATQQHLQSSKQSQQQYSSSFKLARKTGGTTNAAGGFSSSVPSSTNYARQERVVSSREVASFQPPSSKLGKSSTTKDDTTMTRASRSQKIVGDMSKEDLEEDDPPVVHPSQSNGSSKTNTTSKQHTKKNLEQSKHSSVVTSTTSKESGDSAAIISKTNSSSTSTSTKRPPPPPPPATGNTTRQQPMTQASSAQPQSKQKHHNHSHPTSLSSSRSFSTNKEDVSSGVLPDVLMTMREKIESLALFDSDIVRFSSSTTTTTTPHQPSSLNHHTISTPSSSIHNGISGATITTTMGGGSTTTSSSTTTNLAAGGMMMMKSLAESVGAAGGGGGGGRTGTSTTGGGDPSESDEEKAAKDNLQRSFQQSINASVLVSLAHKRYERRRLAAMEIEKVVRNLVSKANDYERVRTILLMLSDDYVRSTSEDARKGGVVALAACQIGLKKGDDSKPIVVECKDLILASVVHACQDPNSRVRYYATESLFNVVKVVPYLAIQNMFILFEILRSLYADVDHDVRCGAQLLDKKLKEILVSAINSGTFALEQCIPLFVRFVYMKHKTTKRLVLTWLQEFSDKLLGNPLLEYIHLFLGGVFAMTADASASIRQLALGFLHSVLPKLLLSDEQIFDDGRRGGGQDGTIVANGGGGIFEDGTCSLSKVDFDRLLQSLVTIMEHPDPFVRKVAMFWTSQIFQAHVGTGSAGGGMQQQPPTKLSTASISVRHSLPHILPGILLSIGDTYNYRVTSAYPNGGGGGTGNGNGSTRNNNSTTMSQSFASQTTQSLAQQTNQCLQYMVQTNGSQFVEHLDGLIVTLLEELDSSSGLGSRSAHAEERKSYRVEVNPDGTGIESTGWYRKAPPTSTSTGENSEGLTGLMVDHHYHPRSTMMSGDGAAGGDYADGPHNYNNAQRDHQYQQYPWMDHNGGTGSRSHHNATTTTSNNNPMILSRICALQWIATLYDYVVPHVVKADYAKEFVPRILKQLIYTPPDIIVYKSFEVLAKITVPVKGEPRMKEKQSNHKSNRNENLTNLIKDYQLDSFGGEQQHQPPLSKSKEYKQHRRHGQSDVQVQNTHTTGTRGGVSRDRMVFHILMKLFSKHHYLLLSLSKMIQFMCTLQPSEFIFVSFAAELILLTTTSEEKEEHFSSKTDDRTTSKQQQQQQPSKFHDLEFLSCVAREMNLVLLTSKETNDLRLVLKDCMIEHNDGNDDNEYEGSSHRSRGRGRRHHETQQQQAQQQQQRRRFKVRQQYMFKLLFAAFSHNISAALSLSLWCGSYQTVYLALHHIDPMDVHLLLFVEFDQLIELLERPIFRHLHLRILGTSSHGGYAPQRQQQTNTLARALHSLLMVLPQSSSYGILKERLLAAAKFRQGSIGAAALWKTQTSTSTSHGSSLLKTNDKEWEKTKQHSTTVQSSSCALWKKFQRIRTIHNEARWNEIRQESLELSSKGNNRTTTDDEGQEQEEETAGTSTNQTKEDSSNNNEPTNAVVLVGGHHQGVCSSLDGSSSSFKGTNSSGILQPSSFGMLDNSTNVTPNAWKDVWMEGGST